MRIWNSKSNTGSGNASGSDGRMMNSSSISSSCVSATVTTWHVQYTLKARVEMRQKIVWRAGYRKDRATREHVPIGIQTLGREDRYLVSCLPVTKQAACFSQFMCNRIAREMLAKTSADLSSNHDEYARRLSSHITQRLPLPYPFSSPNSVLRFRRIWANQNAIHPSCSDYIDR